MQILILHAHTDSYDKVIYIPTSSIVAFTRTEEKNYTHMTLTQSYVDMKERPEAILAMIYYLSSNPNVVSVDAKTACPEYLL